MLHRLTVSTLLGFIVMLSSISSVYAFDTGIMSRTWHSDRSGVALVYFDLAFHETRKISGLSYGFAFSMPNLSESKRGVGLITDRPRVLDLSFSGPLPATLNIGGSVAWSQDSGSGVYGKRHSFLASGKELAWMILGAGVVVGTWAIVDSGGAKIKSDTLEE